MMSTLSNSRAPCPPSTSDFLEFHAIQSPNKVAIDWNHQTHTYAQMHQDLVRVTHALHALGLQPGQLALIHQINPYIHILLMLACENLQVSTASLPTLKGTVLFERADVILSGVPAPHLPLAVHLVDAHWLSSLVANQLQEGSTIPAPPPQWIDILRVTRSSGTTGTPKLIRLNRGQLDYLIKSWVFGSNYSNSTVFMALYGFEAAIIWRQISACLRAGGTAVWGSFTSMAKKYQLTHMWLLPVDIAGFLEHIPENWKKIPGLVVFTGGAQLPDILRSKACQGLCDKVIHTYGANEVGLICDVDDNKLGTLKPGVDMCIVDDQGRPLAIGEEGDIAVRTPGMIQEYWEQTDYSERHFHDGWFFPGDKGKLVQPRVLQLLGRTDELLNFGGIKRSPEFIEKVFMSLPKVLEAAATSMKRSDGVDVLLVAVVLKDPSALAEVQHSAHSQLSSLAPELQVFACSAIPRTPNGKVKRLAVRELALAPSGTKTI